jgi:hypothetical protein
MENWVEALEVLVEAEAIAERREEFNYSAARQRLRGVFLAAIDADDTQVEASLSAAIRTAQEQKSISMATRAEGTYAEYRGQKRVRQEDEDSDCLFASVPSPI